MAQPIPTRIITAKEAHEKSEEILCNKCKEKLFAIMACIHEQVKIGEFHYSGDGVLQKEVRKELEELGYEIETGSQYNEQFYNIKW